MGSKGPQTISVPGLGLKHVLEQSANQTGRAHQVHTCQLCVSDFFRDAELGKTQNQEVHSLDFTAHEIVLYFVEGGAGLRYTRLIVPDELCELVKLVNVLQRQRFLVRAVKHD